MLALSEDILGFLSCLGLNPVSKRTSLVIFFKHHLSSDFYFSKDYFRTKLI